MKKTSMLNSVRSPRYTQCYSSSNSRPVTTASNTIRCNSQKIWSQSTRYEATLEIRQKGNFLEMINKAIIYKFFKDFANQRKETSKMVALSHRPFSNICKYRDHRWELSTIWKKDCFRLMLKHSVSMYEK